MNEGTASFLNTVKKRRRDTSRAGRPFNKGHLKLGRSFSGGACGQLGLLWQPGHDLGQPSHWRKPWNI